MRGWRWYWKVLFGVLVVVFALPLAPLLGLTIGAIGVLAACGMPPAHTLWTLKVLAMGRNRPLLPAYVLLTIQLGLATWGILLAFSQHEPVSTFVVSAIIIAAFLTWLRLRPGRVVVALLVIFGCCMVVGHGIDVLAQWPTRAASEGVTVWLAGYTCYALMWLATMCLALRGLRIIRRTTPPAEAEQPLLKGKEITYSSMLSVVLADWDPPNLRELRSVLHQARRNGLDWRKLYRLNVEVEKKVFPWRDFPSEEEVNPDLLERRPQRL